MIAYHGTSKENAQRILEEGFRVMKKYVSDPGDFGRGLYLDTSVPRARAVGEVVIVAEVDIEGFYVARGGEAYPTSRDSEWAEIVLNEEGEMGTLFGHGMSREKWSWQVRNEMLKRGYKGFVWRRRDGQMEICVYDPKIIEVIGILTSWCNRLAIT